MTEECEAGFTFRDLRPFFIAVYRHHEQLALSMAAHLESCEACRKKWAFLERTGLKLAERYRKEVKVLVREIEATVSSSARANALNEGRDAQASVGRALFGAADIRMDPAVRDLMRSQNPSFIEVRNCWKQVREIQNEEQRFAQANYLANAAKYVLERNEGTQRTGEPQPGEEYSERAIMKKFMDSVDALDMKTSSEAGIVPFDSAKELLFLASIPATSFSTETAAVEFTSETNGQFRPSQFLRAQKRYDEYVRLNSRREPAVR